MTGRSPPGPPIPLATKPSFAQSFSTVSDAVSSPRGSSTLVSASVTSLDTLQTLQDVFQAVNTLPCIKYIAGIGLKIVQIIQEMQVTNEAVRKIGMRAKDIILAVARSCTGAPEEITGQLESDLQQLTETMCDILDFTQEIATRRTYKKLLNKADDAAAVKSLDTQLTHAFQIFEIQSSVNLRISQQQIVRQLSGMAINSPPPFNTNRALGIAEGLYLIRSAADGRVIETEHKRPAPSYLHAYLAPSNDGISQYQIWIISSKNGRDNDYIIRNFATGASLDVYCGHTQEGTQVICQAYHGGQNQIWSIYGSRRAKSFDYCTIRSHGPPTILDAHCPAGSNCDYLHMTRLRDDPRASQEWTLIRLPSSSLPSRTLVPSPWSPNPSVKLPRRRFVLQNVASGGFATVGTGNGRSPNVCLQNDLKIASSWHFEHVVVDNGQYDDMFLLVTNTGPNELCSLDLWGGRHIAANPGAYKPANGNHMWKAIPKDGSFCFKSYVNGQLLSQFANGQLVHVSPATSYNNLASQWRLIDPTTGVVCPILHDSALAILPPELPGSLITLEGQTQEPSAELMLRTEPASATTRRFFADSFKREHNMVREMLDTGYTSLVLAPRLISGWKVGVGLCDVTLRDEDFALGLPKFRGKKSFDTCHPR